MSELADSDGVVPLFTRFRLLTRLSLLVLVPLVLLAVAAIVNAEDEYRNAELAALETASVIARQAAARLDEHYDEQEQFLTALAEVGRDALARDEDVGPRLRRMLAAMPQHVNGLSVLTLDGRMIATTTTDTIAHPPVSVADRRYFKEALARRSLAVGEPVQSRTNSQWVSISALPVLNEKRVPIGAVSMSTRADRFHDVLVPLGLPLGTLMTVFNERGIGVSSTAEPIAALGRDFTTAPSIVRALRERAFAARIAASDGQQRLTAYAAGEKLPWIVEVGLPIDTTLAPARQQLWMRLAFIASAFAVGLVVAYRLAGWIARPLHTLTGTAERLAGGDFAARAPAGGYHEVRLLGSAFNDMARSVERNQRELKDSEERFRALVLMSSDWYWTQDAAHRFASHSQGRFDDLNLGAGDFFGRTRWEMAGAAPVGTTWEAHRALLDARRPWRDFTVRYTNRDGETHYITSCGEPTFDTAGVFTGYRGVARLMTEQFRFEEKRAAAAVALRESDAKFRALVSLSSDGYWEQDEHYRFTYISWNAIARDHVVVGKTRWELGLEVVGGTWDAHRALLEARRTFRGTVFRYRNRDGELRYFAASGEPVYDEARRFKGYRGTSTDVTARMALEQALQERMDLLRTTLDTTPAAMGLIRRRDNRVLLANRTAYQMFGITEEADWNVLDNWDRKADYEELVKRLKSDGEVRDMEAPVRLPGRGAVWASLSARPASYHGDSVVVVTVHDVSQRKALEAEALKAHERLTHLSRRVLDAQEAERRLIAHELHDEIGQNLSALKLFAGHMRRTVPDSAHADLDEWTGILDQSIAQVRDLSRLLRPVQLDHMGLVPALRAMLETQARAAGWVTEFTADEPLPSAGNRAETVLYRVVQEALSNVARHGAAARVSVAVREEGSRLAVDIVDDGRGFDLAAARERVQQGLSMGLLGMEERVRLAGGEFTISSTPAEGTRVHAVIPIGPHDDTDGINGTNSTNSDTTVDAGADADPRPTA